MKTTAVLLAAGSGSRMGSGVKKQYLKLGEYPILYYSLKTLEESFIDDIVLVTPEDDIEYCKSNIIDFYGFSKVAGVIAGGDERYNSVLNALNFMEGCDYVFIHDAARPMLSQDMLNRCYDAVKLYEAVVVGEPSKDTIKIASEDGFVESTPNRDTIWTVQTPQAFRFDLIKEAYNYVVTNKALLKKRGIHITDDAMVLETYSGHRVKLIEGSYSNIKITTPEDLRIAKEFIPASGR